MAMQPRLASRHLAVALPRDAAEAAATLRWAARLVGPGDALTLLHVRPADITAAPPTPPGVAASPLAALAPVEMPLDALATDTLSGDPAAASEAAQAASALARAAGFEPRLLKLRTELRIADALLAFLAAGDDVAYGGRAPDALVIGSHEAAATPEDPRRAKASRTSVEVATLSPVPVFVVRRAGGTRPAAENGGWVAVAADGRAPASALLARWAARHVITRPGQAAVLAHVAPHGASESPEVEAALTEAADALRSSGARVTLARVATAFDTRDALVDLAASGVQGGPPGAPDLLVLATRGPAPLRRAALGAVAAYVVQHAPAALCLVPPPALAKQGV